MPTPRRIARLQQLILETAATTVQRDLQDPRLGFVTLTRVKLSPDLAAATVYWSCLGTEAERRTSARALERATALVQSSVASALATRTTPTLTFRYDPSIANAARLEGIFAELRRERGETGEEGTEAKGEPADAEGDDEGDADDAEAADEAPGEPPADPADAPPDEPPTSDDETR